MPDSLGIMQYNLFSCSNFILLYCTNWFCYFEFQILPNSCILKLTILESCFQESIQKELRIQWTMMNLMNMFTKTKVQKIPLMQKTPFMHKNSISNQFQLLIWWRWSQGWRIFHEACRLAKGLCCLLMLSEIESEDPTDEEEPLNAWRALGCRRFHERISIFDEDPKVLVIKMIKIMKNCSYCTHHLYCWYDCRK